VIGNAVKVMRIATGGESDAPSADGKNKAAQELGRNCGAARAKTMTSMRTAEIAKEAAARRWGKGQAAPGKKEPVWPDH
jgi:hypothetical protein